MNNYGTMSEENKSFTQKLKDFASKATNPNAQQPQ